MKKSQGLSLTTVVIAALALLVLIILSVIFVGRMARVNEKSKDCEQLGASCYDIAMGANCGDHGDRLQRHPEGECQKTDANGNKVRDESRICCMTI